MVMRRRRAWSDTRFSDIQLVNSNTNKKDLLAGLTPADTKTVTRVLVDLSVSYASSFAQDGSNSIDIGIGVVSQEAFDLETLPDPNAVADYPQQGWLYVATKRCVSFFTTSTGVTVIPALFQVDLRAQRKVDRGVLFMVILNTADEGGSATVFIHGRVRALCLT